MVVGGSSEMGRQTAADVAAAGGSAVIIGQDPDRVEAHQAIAATPSSAYSVAKAGLRALMHNLALDLALHRARPDLLAARSGSALGSWFETGSLAALRELALLWLAATLASDPPRHRPGGHDPGGGQARKRVVVALSGGSEGELLIRRAARIAARCGGDLLAVHATRPGGPAGRGVQRSPPSDS